MGGCQSASDHIRCRHCSWRHRRPLRATDGAGLGSIHGRPPAAVPLHRLYESDRASYDRPIYVHLFPRYFPTLVGGRRQMLLAGRIYFIKATLVDNLITSPFRYLLFPAHLFYLFKNSVIVHARVLYVDTRHSPHCGKKRLFCFLREYQYGFSPVLRCCAARLTPEMGGWSPHTGRSASWCTSHDTPRVSRPRHVSSTQLGGECSVSWGDSVTHPRPSDTTLELFTPPRSCARARQSARDAAARRRRRVIPAPRRAAAAPAPARSRAAPPRPPAGL